jgi:hypothetical protein
MDVTRDAMRMHGAGKRLSRIGEAIEATYAKSHEHRTPTPPVPAEAR